MDFDTIKIRFDWFKAEANSWTELGDQCKALADQLQCISVTRDNEIFGVVYDAYDNIRSAFITGTDGQTGTGYGVAAQLCPQVHDLLLTTAKEYARYEAQTAADLTRVEKMINQ